MNVYTERLVHLHQELLDRGVLYRFTQEVWEARRSLGLAYSQPIRQFSGGVDETLQLPSNLYAMSAEQRFVLERLSLAWAAAFRGMHDLLRRHLLEGINFPFSELLAGQINRENFLLQPGYSSETPFVRFDIVPEGDNGFAFIDINTSRSMGVGLHGMITKIVQSNGFITEPREWFDFSGGLIATVEKCYLDWCNSFGVKPKANPKIVVAEGFLAGGFPNAELIAEFFRDQGFTESMACDPEELSFSSGELAHDGQAVDICLRQVKPDMQSKGEAIRRAYPKACCVISPLYRRVLGSKIWFRILREYPELVFGSNQEMADLVSGSIPETHIIQALSRGYLVNGWPKASLTDFTPHSDWVLKPIAGSSAKGVQIGFTMTRDTWDKKLEVIRDGLWVMQRFVKPPKVGFWVLRANALGLEKKNFLVKLGAYVYGEKLIGVDCMATHGSYLVHGGRSTIMMPVPVS